MYFRYLSDLFDLFHLFDLSDLSDLFDLFDLFNLSDLSDLPVRNTLDIHLELEPKIKMYVRSQEVGGKPLD